MSWSDFQFVLLSWLDGWVGWAWVAKKACTLSLRPPSPPPFQLSNPLPNSPGTPTHLGHPHGQLSLSTLVHQTPQVQQPPASPGWGRKLFKSLRQMQVFGLLLLRNLVHKFRPPVQLLHLLHHSWRKMGTSSQIIHHFVFLESSWGWVVARCCLVQTQRGRSIKLKSHHFHRNWPMNTFNGEEK